MSRPPCAREDWNHCPKREAQRELTMAEPGEGHDREQSQEESTSNITERYTLIEELKTWTEAQQYCREHHTDLVSTKSASENEDLVKKAQGKPFWIGNQPDPQNTTTVQSDSHSSPTTGPATSQTPDGGEQSQQPSTIGSTSPQASSPGHSSSWLPGNSPAVTECQEALQAARTACLQSRALCREVKEAVDQAVSLGRAAHKATNDGLTQKIAETVNLTQHLQVSSGESRVAIQRVQRWYDENEHSEGRVLGPVSSADLLTRERLDRPQVQVYQRHAGTQLPEATAIVQGYAALRQSLLNTSQDLSLLHRTRLQLEENMQGKRAAAGLDSAIARLRRRNSDHRWTVPHLK
ncbi:UNVERIFIED_CONTAM: hypothetical protein FKN15_045055 [Acipenser sinensis]